MKLDWVVVTVVVVCIFLSSPVSSFSSGAPLSVCDGDMKPRHGFEPQTVDSPAELVLDRHSVPANQYLRVTLRSSRPIKGFLIKAEDALLPKPEGSTSGSAFGTWFIPYLNDTSYLSEARYLHCDGGKQSVVTHSGRTSSLYIISFQWKPPEEYKGIAVLRATVVVDYKTYWVDLSAPPITILPAPGSDKSSAVLTNDVIPQPEEAENYGNNNNKDGRFPEEGLKIKLDTSKDIRDMDTSDRGTINRDKVPRREDNLGTRVGASVGFWPEAASDRFADTGIQTELEDSLAGDSLPGDSLAGDSIPGDSEFSPSNTVVEVRPRLDRINTPEPETTTEYKSVFITRRRKVHTDPPITEQVRTVPQYWQNWEQATEHQKEVDTEESTESGEEETTASPVWKTTPETETISETTTRSRKLVTTYPSPTYVYHSTREERPDFVDFRSFSADRNIGDTHLYRTQEDDELSVEASQPQIDAEYDGPTDQQQEEDGSGTPITTTTEDNIDEVVNQDLVSNRRMDPDLYAALSEMSLPDLPDPYLQEKDRMPRLNGDNIPEGSYKLLESEYGDWKNSANNGMCCYTLLVIAIMLCSRIC